MALEHRSGASRGDVEDELVSAALQISEMRQEAKVMRKTLATTDAECIR